MGFFDYFQFIFLIFFWLLFIIRTVLLTRQGEKVFVIGSNKKGAEAVIEMLAFPLLLLWAYEVITHSLHIQYQLLPDALFRSMVHSMPLQIAGIGLIVTGFLFFCWGLYSFGKSWRIGIDKNSPGNLITTGAFSLSRNPVFLFFNLYFIGTWLVYSNIFFLIYAVVGLFVFHLQIKKEELFLKGHYGREYLLYTEKTRRYI